jgi:dsRNA-specific ribonuclease
MTGPIGMHALSVRNAGGRRVEQQKWDWMEAILGAIVSAIGTVLALTSWIRNRLLDLDHREQEFRKDVDSKIQVLHGRISPMTVEIAEMRQQHHSNIQRLNAIDNSIHALDVKQDKQMKLLYQLVGRSKQEEEDDA